MKRAMRKFASTVTVVAIREDGSCLSMLATAVASLSLSPPSVVVCINQKASMYDYLVPKKAISINFLRSTHKSDAEKWATASTHADRFAIGRWSEHSSGAPYIVDAQATLFCSLERLVEFGTHGIAIAGVTDVSVSGSADPLVYAEGAYRKLASL